MQITILIPFRPSRGGHNTPNGRINQIFEDNEFKWIHEGTNSNLVRWDKDEENSNLKIDYMDVDRAIKSIRKNSVYKHKIMILVDSDVLVDDRWIKSFGDNVFVRVSKGYNLCPHQRGLLCQYEIINELPDDEIVCFCYISDLICGKYWDKYIEESFSKYGDGLVHVPMWVEPRNTSSAHLNITGPSLKKSVDAMGHQDGYNIWVTWRKNLCKHALSMKPPLDRNYYIEKDFDDWSAICNSYNIEDAKREKAGERTYAYFAAMIARNKIFKNCSSHLINKHRGGLSFDDNLVVDKLAITKSHLFHLHNICVLDDIEVEHKLVQ